MNDGGLNTLQVYPSATLKPAARMMHTVQYSSSRFGEGHLFVNGGINTELRLSAAGKEEPAPSPLALAWKLTGLYGYGLRGYCQCCYGLWSWHI